MDSQLAARMAAEIVGTSVAGWRALDLLGAGKSALVLRAEKAGQIAALKIFDPDLVERFGEATQLARIEREKRLIGKSHKHLVRIYDGGKCDSSGRLFVAMQLIPAKDLTRLLTVVPRDRIRPLVAQLASAARFLHENELAHRDIKPSNIAVSDDFEHLTLLDLGVLRPFGEPGLTDVNGQPFVGTLQYSSPEFLFRREEDTPEGWQALAFYQIGAVIHDLLKGRTIFEEFSIPYPRMVEAVKYETPDLNIPGADQDLVALAKVCLVKDPAVRLRLVTWESFAASPPPLSVASIKDRVMKKQAVTQTVRPEAEPVALNRGRALNDLLGRIATIIRDECQGNPVFPPVEVHDHPPPDGESVAFRAAFPEAADKNLPVAFALLIQIRLLDVAANIVEIGASAAVAQHVWLFAPAAFAPAAPLYRGPFGNDAMKNRIEYALYAAVEVASAESPLSDPEPRALTVQIPDATE